MPLDSSQSTDLRPGRETEPGFSLASGVESRHATNIRPDPSGRRRVVEKAGGEKPWRRVQGRGLASKPE